MQCSLNTPFVHAYSRDLFDSTRLRYYMVTQLHPPSTLAPLHSTHHTTQVHSAQRRAARTLQPRRECIWSPAGQLDQKGPPSTGGVGRC